MENCFGVDLEERKGGLTMMWKNDIKLKFNGFSKNHIDMVVEQGAGLLAWRLTGFYGEPEKVRRKETRRLFKGLAIQDDLPWCCFGDFNEILLDHEKSGGCLRREGQMVDFREALDKCKLDDLGFLGNWYTWERGNTIENNIRERIDRAVATRS